MPIPNSFTVATCTLGRAHDYFSYIITLFDCNLYSRVIYVEVKFNGIIQRNKVIKLDIHKCSNS